MPYVAAGLLASLTIRVFFELQDYGPESAIRRFSESISHDNLSELEAVTVTKELSSKEKAMVARLANWHHLGVSMQVGRIERTGTESRAAVVFSYPSGNSWGTVWVVQRSGKEWRVNVNKTATIFWDSVPPQ